MQTRKFEKEPGYYQALHQGIKKSNQEKDKKIKCLKIDGKVIHELNFQVIKFLKNSSPSKVRININISKKCYDILKFFNVNGRWAANNYLLNQINHSTILNKNKQLIEIQHFEAKLTKINALKFTDASNKNLSIESNFCKLSVRFKKFEKLN